MRQQRVLLGELMIDREPPIQLHVELPSDEAAKKVAALKERLVFLLDTRFRPANPEPDSRMLPICSDVAAGRCCVSSVAASFTH